MALDSITGRKLTDRVLFEVGKKVPDADFPPEWWIDAINESVDTAVLQLIDVAGIAFLMAGWTGLSPASNGTRVLLDYLGKTTACIFSISFYFILFHCISCVQVCKCVQI